MINDETTPPEAWQQGRSAARANKTKDANPYPKESELHLSWLEGYFDE